MFVFTSPLYPFNTTANNQNPAKTYPLHYYHLRQPLCDYAQRKTRSIAAYPPSARYNHITVYPPRNGSYYTIIFRPRDSATRWFRTSSARRTAVVGGIRPVPRYSARVSRCTRIKHARRVG